jgi:hypothetical protein
MGRTVRTGHADRTACCRGLSAHTPRTVRPCAADRPKKQTEPTETTPNNGPFAGSMRTVRQVPADRPPGTRGPSETSPNENSKPRRIETKGAWSSRIVREVQTEQKMHDPESQLPQIIIGFPKR